MGEKGIENCGEPRQGDNSKYKKLQPTELE